MPDRTAEVSQFIQGSYPTFEFVPIRLSNAFDKRWWRKIRGGALAKSDFGVQLNLGIFRDLSLFPCPDSPPRRPRIQTFR